MEKIISVIVDDEINNCLNLRTILNRYCEDLEVVATAHSAIDGIDIISKHKPQLVFLDIEMPDGSGFDLLERISNLNFEVIFVTAYDQYAIKAIKLSAIDYLLKPINILDLKTAVSRATDKIRSTHKINQTLSHYLSNIKTDSKERTIALPTSERVVFAKVDEIVRMKGENNYTQIHLIDGKKILISKTIKEYENLLKNDGFIRTHQSHLVNKIHVKSYEKRDGGYLKMTDDSSISISRQRKEEVLLILNQ